MLPMLTTQTPDMPLTRLLLLPAIILLFLTACQPVQGPLSRTQPTEIETVPAETEGQYQQAAEEYLQLATEYDGERQALYFLRAAELFWQTGQVEQANTALQQVNKQLLSDDKQFSAAVVGAEIALFNSQGESALAALTDIDASSLNAEDRVKLLKLRSDAYTLTSNWLEKANTHLQLEKLLSDEAAIEQNRETLWQALQQMTPQALDLHNPGYPPADDSGWFALAYAIKAYQDNPETLEVALEDWRRSYPNHPADPSLYKDSLKAAGARLPQQIGDIAVMLPAEGPFVDAGRAIKQGIIAAHYASGASSRLHFLDVETDPYSGRSNVAQLYQEAISRGASVVIGPLQKPSVEALAKLPDLPVPVLALNRIEAGLKRPNLYQFGLAPEDDAMAVADFARRKGYQHAVILAPQGDWGDRVATAFSQAWREQGGNILSVASYSESENDFRDTLIPLMGLDVSEQRYRTLKSVLGRSLDFEPRRRQDIDFLFLVARPLKARQLVPQLKFHRSGDLPLIATSHAYSGQADPQQDIDLNDLIITDIPWMFVDETNQDQAYQAVLSQTQGKPGSLLRLYAMGTDAYRLISELNQLSREPEQVYQGATGDLSVNEAGQVEREMRWGQFKQGSLQRLQ
jgi:outer membrane PBP1 activator LpoA protein